MPEGDGRVTIDRVRTETRHEGARVDTPSTTFVVSRATLLVGLQRSAGNQAVQQLIRRGVNAGSRLQEAAKKDGHDVQIASGFRRYEEQKALRKKFVEGTGNKAALAATGKFKRAGVSP
jgi:LAS superfamily LD-carboxypeptidase LdcB